MKIITNLNTDKIKKTLFTILETVLLSRVLAIFVIFKTYPYTHISFFKPLFFMVIYMYSLIPEIVIRFVYRKSPRKNTIVRIYKILLHLGVFCIFLLVLYDLLPYDLLRKLYIHEILGFPAFVITLLTLRIILQVKLEKGRRALFSILEIMLLSRLLAIFIIHEYVFFYRFYFVAIYIYSLIPEIIIRFVYRKSPRKNTIVRIYKILLHLGVFCIYLLILYKLLPYDLLKNLCIDKILQFPGFIILLLIIIFFSILHT